MQLYRFSPLKNSQECTEALEFIHHKLRELSELVLEEKLPINTLKIFAHYPDEYDFLRSWANEIGVAENDNSTTSYYVKVTQQFTVNGESIEYVGIRVPDPYRSQVGCGDFVVPNYEEFKSKYLGHSAYIREVKHPNYQMLELFHPDIDVLGYIVKE
jgi:hypothetical protein